MSNFDEIQEFIWDLRGDFEHVKYTLAKQFPNASILVVTTDPIILPPGVVACCGNGEGEIEPVARWELTKAVTSYTGKVLEMDVEQFWTSPASTWDDPSGWDLFFWDNEMDDEVFLK